LSETPATFISDVHIDFEAWHAQTIMHETYSSMINSTDAGSSYERKYRTWLHALRTYINLIKRKSKITTIPAFEETNAKVAILPLDELFLEETFSHLKRQNATIICPKLEKPPKPYWLEDKK